MEFEIKKGILDKQIDQLIEYSLNDESVGKLTSDRERFKNRQAFEKWQDFSSYSLSIVCSILGSIFCVQYGIYYRKKKFILIIRYFGI